MDIILESYKDSWEQIITPDDYKYHESELEPAELDLPDDHRVRREDFKIYNTKGKRIECSLYRNSDLNKELIVYSHSHSGNKAEGAYLVEAICPHFNLMVFDYTGYGYSDNDHCTLGLKEMDDLECVVEHARHYFKFNIIFVWGRSMGAVTATLLAHRSKGNLFQGLLVDSPFSSTKEMVCNVMEKIPNFLLYFVFSPLGKKLQEITGYDIMSIDLKPLVPELKIPAIFAIADDDTLAGVDDLQRLFDSYGSRHDNVNKKLMKFQGDHASKRPSNFFDDAINFFLKVEASIKESPSYQGLNHHLEAQRRISAMHHNDSPSRLKKLSLPPNIDNSLGSLAELPSENLPFKVRATPSQKSRLTAVRGEDVNILVESPQVAIINQPEQPDHEIKNIAETLSAPQKQQGDREVRLPSATIFRNTRFAELYFS